MSNLQIKHQESLKLNAGEIQFKFDVNYVQGAEAAEMQFSLICENVPFGSTVGFSSNTPGPNPPINLPPTMVVTYPTFIVGILSYVPENYTAVITITGNFSEPLSPNFSISLQAAYLAGD
jgi:hypothetical protein